MRKIAKSKQMKFLDDFARICSELGGEDTSKDPGYFTFATKGGPVTVRANAEGLYSIFGRFKDGDDAAIALGYKRIGEREYPWGKRPVFDDYARRLSSYTGKWNFHGDDADAILNSFRDELNAILLLKEVAS